MFRISHLVLVLSLMLASSGCTIRTLVPGGNEPEEPPVQTVSGPAVPVTDEGREQQGEELQVDEGNSGGASAEQDPSPSKSRRLGR